jgi:hypothetical protein
VTGAPDSISPRRRREVVDALRRGTVPAAGLDLLAVGLDRVTPALDRELDAVCGGGSVFKAIRGEYGAGKTFLVRWLAERALRRGLATAEIQVSETETPLHRLETVYRRLTEALRTAAFPPSALQPVLDSWLYTLEGDAADADPASRMTQPAVPGVGGPGEVDAHRLAAAVDVLLERRLAAVSTRTPLFAQALRGYHAAVNAGDLESASGLAAWLGGQPNVGAAVKRPAGIRGELDHFGAMGFLQGLLTVLKDSGHPGLLVVLDEVETLQRMRSDVRDKALNALRQLLDEVDSGRFPGLYLVITGTPAFFDGPSGVNRLPPLAQRLATDFTGEARFDNPRAVQIRLPGFDLASLVALGVKVRDLYASDAADPGRLRAAVDDAYLAELADALGGTFGGRVGIVPRILLKKLVGDVLDRVDQFPDYDPRRHYQLTVRAAELSDVERNAARLPPPQAADADDVELDV